MLKKGSTTTCGGSGGWKRYGKSRRCGVQKWRLKNIIEFGEKVNFSANTAKERRDERRWSSSSSRRRRGIGVDKVKKKRGQRHNSHSDSWDVSETLNEEQRGGVSVTQWSRTLFLSPNSNLNKTKPDYSNKYWVTGTKQKMLVFEFRGSLVLFNGCCICICIVHATALLLLLLSFN